MEWIVIEWTNADQCIAYGSGWAIFESFELGVHIERLDDPSSVGYDWEPKFDSDDDALRHVEEAAACGDLLAQKALAYIQQCKSAATDAAMSA